MVAVINKFRIANGIIILHPKRINWSYLNLGRVHRTHIKQKIQNTIFSKKHRILIIPIQFSPTPLSTSLFIYGKLYPPKNRVLIKAEFINILIYSAKRKVPNFMELYSVWNPPTNSDSHSAKSNGALFNNG